MLNEFKRPMWNDGPAKQPWLNYFNEYERTHCCFGDDDNPDESENGVERGELGDFNVDPGYNPDTSMNQVDGGFVSDAGTSFTTDPTTGELNVDASGRVGPDGTVGIEGELGYNDLADMGYFDAVQADIQARDQQVADAIVADQSALGRDVNVTVDKAGNYTYTGADKWGALGGELSKAYSELSPTVQLGKTIDELGGIGSVLGKAKDDFVDSISGIFSGSPSAKQTSPSVSNPQASLSGLQSLGAGTEFSAMQAAANKADKEQAELDAQIALEEAIGLGQRAEEGYSGPSSLFSSGFDTGIGQRMSQDYYTDPNKVTVTELSGSVPAPATPRADQVNVTPLSGSVTNEQLAAMQSLRQDVIAEMAMKALGKGERDKREAEKRQAENRAATEQQRMEDIVNVLDLPSLSDRQVRGITSPLGGPKQTEADRRRDALETVRAEIREEKRRQANLAAIDDMLKNRSGGGMVYRNEGGEVEEKTKSAMELYLEKLGQPSKYTIPTVPMNTPSMAPPPDTSDPFALAEYRKNLARETMGNYLPYDAGGASSAINTFNENYYGGASNVNPYNVAQLASLYGLPRDAATYEGIIGMLGGVRSEAPPPPPVVPDPEPEPEPPIVVEEEDDDNWSDYDDEEIDNMGYLKGGGGIRDVLYRQTGGAAAPNFTTIAMPGGVTPWSSPNVDYFPSPRPGWIPKINPGKLWPGPTMPGHPDYPGTLPPWPPYPEPPYPEPPKPEPPPPPPPPEPKIIYDPVREEAARKRARELQAIKIGKLDTAPQTTAERLALEKSGGFYRDDAGNVRDASGAFQEDFAYDYTAPPPIDSGPSGDDWNFTGDPDPVPEPPPPADPIPLPGPDDPLQPMPYLPYVGNPEAPGPDRTDPDFNRPRLPYQPPEYTPFKDYTGPKTMADLGNKGMGGSHFTPEFTQYLEGQGYTIDMTPTHTDGAPQIINQQGQLVDFNKPIMPPAGVQDLGPSPTFTMGQQLQPTGLQGLQQGMDQGYLSQLYGRPALQQPNYMQNPNYISQPIRPSMQSQNMQGLGQNLQGFGMQSPVPFGTQQPFSSGFGGFGQPMMGQTLRGTGF